MTDKTKTYSGWSNRETWNVSLWLNNEEATYKELHNLQCRAETKEELAIMIRELCQAIWPTGQTPDGDLLSECDWAEIAESEWNEDDHDVTNQTQETIPHSADSEKLSMYAFLMHNHVAMTSRRVTERPDGLMTDSHRHFRCTFTRSKRFDAEVTSQTATDSLGVYFSQGDAHTDLPNAADVLNCLALDASSFEQCKNFADWANGLGYDPDSRKAEKIYKLVKRQAEQLKRFLGPEAYETLLYKTEPL